MRGIKESDWKRLRDLKPILLDRYCARVLADLENLSKDATLTPHQRYGEIYGLIHARDKELAYIFDDLRRSNAIIKLMLMREAGLLEVEEVAAFSEDTREATVRRAFRVETDDDQM